MPETVQPGSLICSPLIESLIPLTCSSSPSLPPFAAAVIELSGFAVASSRATHFFPPQMGLFIPPYPRNAIFVTCGGGCCDNCNVHLRLPLPPVS